MLDIKSCLKISFQGDTGFIICETGSSYDQIIDQICTRFNIPQSQRAGLVLSNGQGYMFEQQLLEYFLLLFPCPELTFQLRIDWQKLRRSIEKQSRPNTESSANPVEQHQPEAEAEYVAVPVHRQNCFLGALPTSFASAPTALRRQHSFVQQQRQHQLQLQQQPPLRALRQLSSVTAARPHHSQAKRLRLQLCQRSRRPAPAAAAPHLALLATAVAAATASRSIRI